MRQIMRVPLVSAVLALLLPRVAAETKIASACSPSLSDSDPPVLEPLRAVIGDDYANLFVGLLGDSSVSKFLVSDAGSSCLANMNGTALGQALVASTAVDSCASALELLDVPMVQYAVGNFSLALSSSNSEDSATDTFIEGLRLVDEQDVEQICSLYVNGFVPCLRSQVLPSLATLRSTAANGCCAAWDSESVELFDYTLTGQYTKIAQLIGDVLCATQTPAFNGTSSQRCGYTFLQSSGEVANTTSADRAASLLQDLQVPTDQACSKAEGEAYNDTDGNAVAASSEQFTPSGCVVALDRLATWVDGLPLAANSSESYGIALQSLFGAGKCISGAEVFPAVVQSFLPSSIVDAVSSSFSAACLHVPTKYSDGCSFSRPASLVDWDYEPTHASQAGSEEGGGGTSAINSLNTVPPNVTDSSAAISTRTPVFTTATLALSFFLMSLW